METLELSKEQQESIREWRALEQTQEVFKILRKERQSWLEQSCQGPTAEDSHSRAAMRDGAIAALNTILVLGLEDGDSG